MQSAFDIQISYLTEILKQSQKDSQHLTVQINQVKQQLEQLHRNIQSKFDGCLKQIQPRLQQLQKRIQVYWEGVQQMDDMAWKELQQQKIIFENCKCIVEQYENRISSVHQKI